MADVKIPPNQVFGQFIGELILSYVLARFVVLLTLAGKAVPTCAVSLWTEIPSALRVGSILWHNLPWILAAVDRSWRVKTLLGFVIHALA